MLSFNFAKIPHLLFGVRKIETLKTILPKETSKLLLISAPKEILNTRGKFDHLLSAVDPIEIFHETVVREPSPESINALVKKYRHSEIDVIIAIGGGSTLDTGKAVSAMILHDDPVEEFLEGVGTKEHNGVKIPFIAIPTTSGTGSEATKNAVLSRPGKNGYKKSLRHDNFVPDHVIIDPEFMITCPSSVTASTGMDAFTQLLESYVSTNSNPITDALALSGMHYSIQYLIPTVIEEPENINYREGLAYAALCSGITLANAGLGTVHGFASSVGGLYDIPHGVVCGTLMAETNRITIERLQESPSEENMKYLRKFATVGALFRNKQIITDDEIDLYCKILVERLQEMTNKLNLKRLGDYGVNKASIDAIIPKTSNKNNPIQHSKEDLRTILENRI
ncbi:MAG: iron-containing alcohol dehydrogenase [Promethearchaeota archaeon]|nr:MAG: iron-containing alcohol dehydrogenase [Candidatus Lokiarchaeota archaeon]